MLVGQVLGISHRQVLWKIVEPMPAPGLALIWPKLGVLGHPTGKVEPHEIGGDVIEVVEGLVRGPRAGLSEGRLTPAGFQMETLIVLNQDGTMSPAHVWVGDRLNLVSPESA